MKLDGAPPIFSRIMLAVSALIVVGVVFIFVSKSLEPANIIPAALPKKAEKFNPKADVSEHPVFPVLVDYHMEPVPDMPMGRDNPFDSIIKEATTTVQSGQTGQVPRSGLRLSPINTSTQATSTDE